MDAPFAPICLLPEDALLQIFSSLSLRQIIVCQSVSKFFRHLLTSPFFARHLLVPVGSQLRLVSVRPPRHRRHNHHHRKDSCHSPPSPKSSTVLHAFDPSEDRWLRFSLEFLPFRYLHPIAASSFGLVYLWGVSIATPSSRRSLIACNPLTGQFKADICQTCGSAGYSEALIYCYNCEEVAVHRYCLEVIPKTFDEYVYWYCDDCKPQNHELGHMEEPRSPPDEGNDSKCLKSSISTSPEEDDQQNLDAAKSAQPSISEEKLRKRLTMIKITEDLKGGNEWKDSPCLIAGTDAHIAESGQLSWPICNQEDANSHGGNSPSSNLESENATFQVPDPAENLFALATLDLSKSAMDIDYVPAQTIIDPIWRGSLQIRKHSSNLEIENATFQVVDPAENLSALPALDSPKSAMDIDYVPAQPIIDPIWRGSLQIRKHRGVYSCKIVAHMSQLACARVTEEAKLFPETLYSELQPRLTLWPKGFEGCGPVDDNIALYLFPRSKRDENVFKKIICEMIRNDLAIRATVTHAELLVFSSTKLPLRLWRFQEKLYLWGVFRKKQDAPQLLKLSSASAEQGLLLTESSITVL